VRRFDDTFEEGIGFTLHIPSATTQMALEMTDRAQTAPTGPRGVYTRLYKRLIPNASPISGWTAISLNAITMATGMTFFQTQSQVINYTSFSPNISPGSIYQFELSRATVASGVSGLVGDWNLFELSIEFR
jgi:hypothetical protein